MRVTSSSHSGLGEWVWQRLSAVYLGLFVFYVTLRFWFWPVADFAAWQAWFTLPVVRIAWLLAFASLLIHAWIGIRSVFLDYLQSFRLRFMVSTLFALGLIACGFWVVDILYGRGG